MNGTLFLVATPIGNLGDISTRALETLREVDFIAAEDTRVTLKLLSRYEIKKPLVSYFEHNRMASGARIIERLLAGESCALVSDAGTPAISDPGEDMVRLCAEAGVEVVPIPGACAAVCALAVSALPSQRFCFEGFLSTARRNRNEHLESIKSETRTMIFYEAPHKLTYTLNDLYAALGDREISISRELTKLHEETLRTTLSGAIAHFEETPPRGEFVLVVAGASDTREKPDAVDALPLMEQFMADGASRKDAARRVADELGVSKNELYDLSLSHK